MHYLNKRAWLIRHGKGVFPSSSGHSIYRLRWESHKRTSWVRCGNDLDEVYGELYEAVKDALFMEISRP